MNEPANARDSADGRIWPLWIEAAPGSEGLDYAEKVEERGTPEKPDRSLLGIREPRLVLSQAQKPNGAAIIMVPGGGYHHQAYDKEGLEVARWLSGFGITAFTLVYRLPSEGHKNGSVTPYMDVQRSLRLVRGYAKDLGVDPGRIGVFGFSAGAHAAACVASDWTQKVHEGGDALDALSARPDFQIQGYPVISMDARFSHEDSRANLLGKVIEPAQERLWSAECRVTGATPKAFLFQTDDDRVSSLNAARYYIALREAGVPAELHIFAEGGHGYALRRLNGPLGHWPELLREWLVLQKII